MELMDGTVKPHVPRAIIDANMLAAPFTLGFNLDLELRSLMGEFDGYVTAATIGELGRMRVKEDIRRKSRALASKYAAYRTVGMGDEAILEAALAIGAVVVTGDKLLQRRARRAGLRVIGIREGHRLEWVDDEF